MWVEFTGAFDWAPPTVPQMETAYLRGHVVCVTRACGTAAIKAGRAREIPAPTALMASAIVAAGNRWPRTPPVEAALSGPTQAIERLGERHDLTPPPDTGLVGAAGAELVATPPASRPGKAPKARKA